LAIDSEIGYLTPMYALNADGVSLFASPYLSQRLDGNAGSVLPAADGAFSAADDASSTPLVTFRMSDFDIPGSTAMTSIGGSDLPLAL
jgi:hypothetical protein